MAQTITTTAGETFTVAESKDLARMLFKRFGRNVSAATAAWRRMLQNNASEQQFQELIAE